MVDKVTAMPKAKLGDHIRRLAGYDVVRLNRAMMIFLGLAGRRVENRGEAVIVCRLSGDMYTPRLDSFSVQWQSKRPW